MLRLLTGAVLAVLLSSCSCDPPAVSGDEDGGPTVSPDDAGADPVEDAGGDAVEDAGVDPEPDAGPPVLEGSVWLQRDDGILARLDLGSGQIEHPLGEVSVEGGVASDGEGLLLFSSHYADGFDWAGRIVRYVPSDGTFTPLNRTGGRPRTIATDGERVATAQAGGSTLREALLGEDVDLVELETFEFGSAVTYNDVAMVYSGEGGIGYVNNTILIADWHCGGLDALPAEGRFLCADAFGSEVFDIGTDGIKLVLDAVGGAEYISATYLGDAHFVAVRQDCSVVSTVPELEDTAPLCPSQFAQHDGALFFSQVNGGLVEVLGTSRFLRAGFALFGSGIAAAGGRLAIAGTNNGDIGVMGLDFSDPWRTRELEDPGSLALDDEGGVFFVDGDRLKRVVRGGEDSPTVHQQPGLVDVSRAGTRLLLALGAEGIGAIDLDDVALSFSAVATAPADRVSGCFTDGTIDDAPVDAVLFDEVTDVLSSLSGDEVTTLLEGVSDLGEVSGIGCVLGASVVATADGAVFARPFDDTGAFRLVATLDSPARFFAPDEE